MQWFSSRPNIGCNSCLRLDVSSTLGMAVTGNSTAYTASTLNGMPVCSFQVQVLCCNRELHAGLADVRCIISAHATHSASLVLHYHTHK